MGAVADAHGPRAAIALEVGQLVLGEVAPAVDRVDDLQLGVVRVGLPAALLEPVREVLGLLVEAEPLEGEGREGGVAQPRVPVVPVARAAEPLRQAARGRGHHRAGRLVGAELEGDHRPLHHLAPAPVVVRVRQPACARSRASRPGSAAPCPRATGGRTRRAGARTTRPGPARAGIGRWPRGPRCRGRGSMPARCRARPRR